MHQIRRVSDEIKIKVVKQRSQYCLASIGRIVVNCAMTDKLPPDVGH